MKTIAICSAFIFGLNGALAKASDSGVDPAAAVQPHAEGAVTLETDAVVKTSSTAPTWKASVASLYYSMQGTQMANADSYSFNHVFIDIQTFAIERSLGAKWKVALRSQYVSNDYELVAKSVTYREQTAGLGDSQVVFTHPVFESGGFHLLADVGAYLPTGSIDEGNAYVPNAHYKYFLQLGSGTVDGSLGLTSLFMQHAYTIGGRLSAIVRDGMNADGYRLGDWEAANAWMDVPVGYGFTPRLSAQYRLKEKIEGSDPRIARSATEYYYHDQTDWAVNLALRFDHALSHTATISAEIGAPLAQGMSNFDNVVISTNYYGSLALAGQF